MKTWEVILILGGVAIVGVLVVMNMQKPKATPVNTSFGNSLLSGNGLATLVGGALNFASGFGKTSPNAGIIDEHTYNPNSSGFVVSGNNLTDPNTGRVLTYGTD